MSRKTDMCPIGKVAVASALLLGLMILGSAPPASAHQDPPACSGTGVQFLFRAFRANGSDLDDLMPSECETITYQITIAKATIGTPCAFEGGTMTITTPDGVAHNVTPGGGVPCIGGTGACSFVGPFNSLTVNYTVNPVDVVAGQITATGDYKAAFSHTGTTHTLNVPHANSSMFNTVEFCPPDTPCVDNFCDPNLYDSTTGALGNCTFNNVPNSTPCPDTDGSQCTSAGCDGFGNCDQQHFVVVCPPDNNPCTADLGCDSATGACVFQPIPNSTPCPDTDNNACTTAGCDGFGNCDQTHVAVVCNPDTNECTDDPPCNPQTGMCTHPPTADSTPCTDTDNLACTTAGCNGAGVCDQQHMDTCPLNDHYQCYEVHREPFSAGPVTIVDQYGTNTNVPVQRPERICAPADKNNEFPDAPTHPEHLVGYKTRYPFLRQTNVHVVDQLGDHYIDVIKPDRLFVPSNKSRTGPAPAYTGTRLDHFECYNLRRTQNTPKFVPVIVTVDDQFATGAQVTLMRPHRFCLPADKDFENPGAENHTGHLLCYKTRKMVFGTIDVSINNQFGLRNIELIKHVEFCLPALKNP